MSIVLCIYTQQVLRGFSRQQALVHVVVCSLIPRILRKHLLSVDRSTVAVVIGSHAQGTPGTKRRRFDVLVVHVVPLANWGTGRGHVVVPNLVGRHVGRAYSRAGCGLWNTVCWMLM